MKDAACSNPAMTFDNAKANPDKLWDRRNLSRNLLMLFTKEEEARIGKMRLLVTRFQRRWRAL